MTVRSIARRILRPPPPIVPIDRTVAGVFERDDGSEIELWRGYRDVVKPTWRDAWWQTRVLRGAEARAPMAAHAAGLLDALRLSATLPAPLESFASAVELVADEHPDMVRPARHGFELVPTEREVAAIASGYRLAATSVTRQLNAAGLAVPGARILEIGAGTGNLTFALAASGADAIGIDASLGSYPTLERDRVRAALLPDDPSTRLHAADAAQLPFEDESFDAVVSVSVVEHLVDLDAVLVETSRVLRPGGIACHGPHPWYCATGGHALCSLDAPWGHVRLTEGEFERYVAELRPYEAADAVRSYREDFQQPRRTFAGLREAVALAGFELVAWEPARRDPPHIPILKGALLADCERRAPEATTDDLLRGALTFTARKPLR
jgi:SAM-dependent methyltransferase